MQINAYSPYVGLPARRQTEVQPGTNYGSPVGGSANSDEPKSLSSQQRFIESTDEMSAALVQFSNRRDLEKNSRNSSGFERVLDEEPQRKADIIQKSAEPSDVQIEELLRDARKLFPDDSDLVLVLRELLRRCKPGDVRRKLAFLLKQVESEADPKSLKAGINCALKARLFGNKLSVGPSLLRASYRAFLATDASELDIYIDWIGSYGFPHRATVLDFIESALTVDVDAQDPSCSRLEFGNLLERLLQLKLLRSADAAFVGQMLKDTRVCDFGKNEKDWLFFLIALLKHSQHFHDLLAEVVGEDCLSLGYEVYAALVQALYRSCKALPPQLFADDHGFENVLEALLATASDIHQHELIERLHNVKLPGKTEGALSALYQNSVISG